MRCAYPILTPVHVRAAAHSNLTPSHSPQEQHICAYHTSEIHVYFFSHREKVNSERVMCVKWAYAVMWGEDVGNLDFNFYFNVVYVKLNSSFTYAIISSHRRRRCNPSSV
jgi:hypothetical protein